MLKTNAHSITNVGSIRDHNEDYVKINEELGLYIVCDGMGGHAAGEVASEFVAENLEKFFLANKETLAEIIKSKSAIKDAKKLIQKAIIDTNFELNAMAEADVKKRGMGTTLVLALCFGKTAIIGHVGDSRVYIFREKEVNQLTDDHSFVNEMLRSGVITKEQAKNHPQANVITRAMGINKLVNPDVLAIEMMKEDSLLLCSDGLYEYFNKKSFLDYHLKFKSDEILNKLIDHANLSGGKDNISAVRVDFSQDESTYQASDVTAEKKVKTLQKIPLFRTLTYRETAEILEIVQLQKFQDGQDVVKENEPGGDIYVILKGKAKIFNENIEISSLPRGAYFGEMALIDLSPRSATVRADGPLNVMRLPRAELISLLKKETSLGIRFFWALLHTMNKRLRETDRKLFEFHKKFLEQDESLSDDEIL